MELSWITKTKVTLVMVLGGIVIGAWLWPLAAPSNPLGVVCLANLDIKVCALLVPVALSLGFIGYFLAWPYGREIGVLAVPTGLAVWGLRSGSMATLMQASASAAQRQEVFASLRWEAFYWLILVAIGWLGTLLAFKIHARVFVHEAIAMAREIDAHSGPGAEHTMIFTIHEGTKVTIERQSGDWRLIRLRNGMGGWIPASTIQVI